MRKYLIPLIIFFVCIDLLLFFYYFRINPNPKFQSKTKEPATPINEYTPNIAISDLTIDQNLLSDQKTIKGSFIIKNKENLSVGEISLIGEFSKSDYVKKHTSELIDSFIIPQKIQLKPNEQKTVTFTRDISPDINNGVYTLTIDAVNQTGLTVGISSLVINDVKGNDRFLEMNWKESKIIRDNEEFARLEGIIFKKSDKPRITLKINNPHNFKISAVPQFTIYARSANFQEKPITIYEGSLFAFAPTSLTENYYDLPIYETPESYLLHLKFIDPKTKKNVSGIQEFRWIVEGRGGKILSLKAEKAERSFFNIKVPIQTYLIGPPDASSISKTVFNVKFLAQDGKKTIATYTKSVLLSAQPTKVSFPIKFSSSFFKKNNILIQAKIIDQTTNQVLDQTEQSMPLAIDYLSSYSSFKYAAAIVFVILIILVVIAFKKKSLVKTKALYIFFLLLSTTIFVLLSTPKDATEAFEVLFYPTMTCSGRNPKTPPSACYQYEQPKVGYVLNISSTELLVDEELTVTETAGQIAGCSNGVRHYDFDVTLPSVLKEKGYTLTDTNLIYTASAINPGTGNLSIQMWGDIINNCFGQCSSSINYTSTITVRTNYYVCTDKVAETCSTTAPYSDPEQCKNDNGGKDCYTTLEGCQSICWVAPTPMPIIITPVPGKHTACVDGTCQLVDGTGIDSCNPADASACTFLTCVGTTCKESNGPFPDSCSKAPPGDTCQLSKKMYRYKKCEGNACKIITSSTPGTNECSTSENCNPCNTIPCPEKTYLRCYAINDAPPVVGACGTSDSLSGIECGSFGPNSFANWSEWQAQDSCGLTQDKRKCNCNGECKDLLQGCWEENKGYTACTTEQNRPACYNKPPVNAPDQIKIFQPDGKNTLKPDGSPNPNTVQTRDIKISWQFNEGPNGCGNNSVWGFASEGLPQCLMSNNNEFWIQISGPSGPIGPIIKISSQGGNVVKTYTHITTTNPLTANSTNYKVSITASNGKALGTTKSQTFSKVEYAKATIMGKMYEYSQNDPDKCRGPNINISSLGLTIRKADGSILPLPSWMNASCNLANTCDGASSPYDNYNCTIKINNTDYDINAHSVIEENPDYQPIFANLDFKFNLKPPAVTSTSQYKNYYCKSTSAADVGNACGDISGTANCPNNLAPEKLCADVAAPVIPLMEFDKNQGGADDLDNYYNILADLGGNDAQSAYYKLKNASYADQNGIQSWFVANPEQFNDTDIGGAKFFITGDDATNYQKVGVATGNGAKDFKNSAIKISPREWGRDNYAKSFYMTPAGFKNYVSSRKEYQDLTLSVTDNKFTPGTTFTSNKIHIVNKPLLILDQDDIAKFQNKNIVLIVNGDLVIDPQSKKFNPSSSSTMIIATGDLTFGNNVEEANGIFIGGTVDLASGNGSPDPIVSDTPLKIVGNLISTTSINTTSGMERIRTDNPFAPSLFVVFDPTPYLKLIHLLSVSNYQWTELVP